MTTGNPPLWIDLDYDTDQASDGHSRYGAYIRQNTRILEDSWNGYWENPVDKATTFLTGAVTIASSPVMAPAYLRCHPRILEFHARRWEEVPIGAEVKIAAGWPASLRTGQWNSGRQWGTWNRRGFGAWEGPFEGPYDDDLASKPYLLVTYTVLTALPALTLPSPPAGPRDDIENRAAVAVAEFAAALNTVITPIISQIEGAS